MGTMTVTQSPSVFHLGEQEVQRLAGTRDLSEKLGRSWHSPTIPPQGIEFLKDQCLIYLSTWDQQGQLWASVLFGVPGFINAEDPSKLRIDPVHRLPLDPAALNPGRLLGTYCIDLQTRRRFRQNGTIASHDGDSLCMDVRVAFPSCPKFIQARKVSISQADLDTHTNAGPAAGNVHTGNASLGQAERDIISRLDTFHLASCYEGSEAEGGSNGCDISHRGGPPGFVQLQGEGTLVWADYVGNYTFTSLGNLHADKRAGILFIDYETGDTLQLTGTCNIRWDEHALPGAERTLYFITKEWIRVERGIPVHVEGSVTMSPYNPLPEYAYNAGVAQDRKQQLQNNYVQSVGGRMMLRCLKRAQEAPDVHTYSFEYQPSSRGKLLADYAAGQYGSFEFDGLGQGNQKNIMRTWTISSPPAAAERDNAFTLTIKNIGLVSGWLAANMEPGRTISFKGFEGIFTPGDCLGDQGCPEAGVLLLAGGIGITPLRAMLPELLQRGCPVTLLYSVRDLQDAVFLSEFAEAAEQSDTLRVHLFLTGGAGQQHKHAALQGVDVHSGRINGAILPQVAPSLQQQVAFLCGPTEMMADISSILESLDFPMTKLHKESFMF